MNLNKCHGMLLHAGSNTCRPVVHNFTSNTPPCTLVCSKRHQSNCLRQEEAAILISRLLLHMKSHVCNQHLFRLPLRMKGCTKCNLITRISAFQPSLSNHAYFDHLSSETYAKHSIGEKAFGPLIVVNRFP